jgi:hypothetical protein
MIGFIFSGEFIGVGLSILMFAYFLQDEDRTW